MGVAVPGRTEKPREGGKADDQGEEAGGGPREEGTSLHAMRFGKFGQQL